MAGDGQARGPEEGSGLEARLKARAAELGLAAIGVAPARRMDDVREVLVERRRLGLHGGMQFTYRNPERSTEPERILPGARSLVVAALPYGERSPSRAEGGPSRASGTACSSGDGREVAGAGSRPVGRVAVYARRDYYGVLRSALAGLVEVLEQEGWRGRVVVDDNALVDRAAAHKAGLGWYGRNCNILLPGLGSTFVLGSVVTDAPLTAGQPVGDGCGTCRRCHSACPTGALIGPGVMDTARCLAWLVQKPGDFPVEMRQALGDRFYGCDDCQDVCPVNKRAARLAEVGASGGPAGADSSAPWPGGTPAAGVDSDELASVDVLDVLEAGDAQLMARYGRWYVPGRDPRILRRNALVVLGNTGDGGDPGVVRALSRYLASGDTMLASHACWAAEQLGRHDLVQASTPLPGPAAAGLGAAECEGES